MKRLNLLNRVPVYILHYCSNGLGSIKKKYSIWNIVESQLKIYFKLLKYNVYIFGIVAILFILRLLIQT